MEVKENKKRSKKAVQNEGKIFEIAVKNSVPDTCWIYRLRDNASSFANGTNTRFASSNICDYILLDDITKTLILIECKSVKGNSISLSVIRNNQIEGLREASNHNLIAGFLINFRNANNDTYFISISEFDSLLASVSKKSFNTKDLDSIGAIRVESTIKRTRYTYNIQKLINDLCKWD